MDRLRGVATVLGELMLALAQRPDLSPVHTFAQRLLTDILPEINVKNISHVNAFDILPLITIIQEDWNHKTQSGHEWPQLAGNYFLAPTHFELNQNDGDSRYKTDYTNRRISISTPSPSSMLLDDDSLEVFSEYEECPKTIIDDEMLPNSEEYGGVYEVSNDLTLALSDLHPPATHNNLDRVNPPHFPPNNNNKDATVDSSNDNPSSPSSHVEQQPCITDLKNKTLDDNMLDDHIKSMALDFAQHLKNLGTDWMLGSSSSQMALETYPFELSFITESPHCAQLCALLELDQLSDNRLEYFLTVIITDDLSYTKSCTILACAML